MRFLYATVPVLGLIYALLSLPLSAGIVYAVADADGTLKVTVPINTSWPFGFDTADAQGGVTIGGTPGGSFSGFTDGSPLWMGSLGANGTTLTANAANPPAAPAPTASSLIYYPFGFLGGNKKGGIVKIPTAGYLAVAKKSGSAGLTFQNTVGNATAIARPSWVFTYGFINNDWDGTMKAEVGKVNQNGADLPANTRAIADVTDPSYLYVASPGDTLSFQVSLSGLQFDIAPDQAADSYYRWEVMFGGGEVAGKDVLASYSGGADYRSPGTYTSDPGTIVSYSSSQLSPGVYWLTADLSVGAEVITPEPALGIVVGLALSLLVIARMRRRPSHHGS